MEKEILERFVGSCNFVYQQFCVWKYSNNKFCEYQRHWNKKGSLQKLIKTNELTEKIGCQYKNFWNIVLVSLCSGWILGINRLIDHHVSPDKKKMPRLSIKYLKEIIEDEEIKKYIELKIKSQKIFFDSIKAVRLNSLAHNDLQKSKEFIINPGAEVFFDFVYDLIEKIKIKYPELSDCNNIDLKYWDKLSRLGVNEVFKKLSE